MATIQKNNTLTNITLDPNNNIYEDDYDLFLEDFNYLEQLLKDGERTNHNRYVVIGDLDLWNGHVIGYQDFPYLSQTLTNIEFSKFCIKDGEIEIEYAHHDGTNYYYVREFRANANVNKFLCFLLNATNNGYTINDEDFWEVVNKYTKKLKLRV